MENARREGGCVYCGSAGPFTDEHVVSAGLGGDDKTWMLRDCVCGECNTTRFSPLEAHLLKQSPASLARLFLQNSTRVKGQAPSFQPRSSYYRDPLSGLLLVSELRAGGEPIVLPQVVFDASAGGVAVTGTASAQLDDFLERLPVAGTSVELIQKKGPKTFYVAAVTLTGQSAGVGEWRVEPKPAKAGVWFEKISELRTPSVEEVPPPSLHRRAKGELICRASSIGDAVKLLDQIAEARDSLLLESSKAKPQQDRRPTMHLGMQTDLVKTRRAVVKIGLNLVAHIHGADALRPPEFDQSVAYVVDGTGAVKGYIAPPNRFGPPAQERHVFMLFTSPNESGGEYLVMTANLYAGATEVFALAHFPDGVPATFKETQVIHVDYNANSIELMSLEQHAERVALSPAYAPNP